MKLKFRTRPWPHQKRALKRMVRQRGGGIQVPMRWGKSWVGINWSAALYHLEGVRQVLVITVTSGLGVWEDQIAQHCPVPWEVLSHHGEVLRRSKAEGDGRLQFMIVNYPNLYARAQTGYGREWVAVPNAILRKFKCGAIIADESHHLGNPGVETSKQAYALARPVKFRLFMTGTMFHRKPFYVFGQMKFYDDGRTFGTAWTHFKQHIAIFRDKQKYVVSSYRNLGWMMDQVRDVVYIETKVPKIPTVKNTLHFDLEGKHLKTYLQMDEHRVLRVGGETLTADIILTKHLWLMMITGGFIKLPESGKYVQVGDCKLRMAEDRLREYMEQDIHKAVIACRFTPEIGALAKIAEKIGFQVITFHGGVPRGKERHRRTTLFQQTKKPTVFISQISAGAESIKLDNSDTILWYSLSESYVLHDQFSRRIERYGDKRTLMHDYLVARGTRDELTLEALGLKMDVTRYLVENPQRAEEISAKHVPR